MTVRDSLWHTAWWCDWWCGWCRENRPQPTAGDWCSCQRSKHKCRSSHLPREHNNQGHNTKANDLQMLDNKTLFNGSRERQQNVSEKDTSASTYDCRRRISPWEWHSYKVTCKNKRKPLNTNVLCCRPDSLHTQQFVRLSRLTLLLPTVANTSGSPSLLCQLNWTPNKGWPWSSCGSHHTSPSRILSQAHATETQDTSYL